MIEIKHEMKYVDSTSLVWLRAWEVWTLNNSLALIKDFIFNIYILKQATFEMVYIFL